MRKLLHVVASPRGERSRTLQVAGAFLERFRACHPAWLIDEINLFEDELPEMAARQVDGKYILLGNRGTQDIQIGPALEHDIDGPAGRRRLQREARPIGSDDP